MPPRTRSRRAAIVARSCWCRSFFPSSRKALPMLRGRFGSPSRFYSPIMALIGPSDLSWMPSRKRKSVSGKVNSRGHGRVHTWRQQRPRRAVASHSAIPSGTLPFSHCEFLTSAGRWRHMTATSTVQRPALLATPPSRSVPCLCPRTTRRMLRPPSPRRYPSTSPRVLLISRVRRSPAPAGVFAH